MKHEKQIEKTFTNVELLSYNTLYGKRVVDQVETVETYIKPAFTVIERSERVSTFGEEVLYVRVGKRNRRRQTSLRYFAITIHLSELLFERRDTYLLHSLMILLIVASRIVRSRLLPRQNSIQIDIIVRLHCQNVSNNAVAFVLFQTDVNVYFYQNGKYEIIYFVKLLAI